jgi:hypothetical protein
MTPQERKNLEDAIERLLEENYTRADIYSHLNNMGERGECDHAPRTVASPAISDEQRRAALHELDFNVMRSGCGKIYFKMNQHTLDCFWHHHYETIRTLLQAPKPDLPFEVAEKDAGRMTWNAAMKKFDGSKKAKGWRLPTKEELDLIYKNKDKFKGLNLSGSYPSGWYWSSSPYNTNDGCARVQRLSDGYQSYDLKSLGLSVRLVRS